MRNLPSLKALKAFDAVARLGSFVAAAAELKVTPSAISHQIRALENQLGVRLLERANRAVYLTDIGRSFSERVVVGFNELEAASLAIERAPRREMLTIHSAPSLAQQWLMPRLRSFQEANPTLDVRLNASPTPVNLLAYEADFDIRFGYYPAQPGVRRMPFPPETMLVLCSPKLVSGDKAIRSPIDMVGQTLIHSEFNLFSWRQWFEAEGMSEHYVDKGPRFDRSFLSISAAIDGQGVCLENIFHAIGELESGRLVAPFGLSGYTVQGHSINFLQSRMHLQKNRSFQTWLLAELGIEDEGV
ncbi:MAG: LysR family transcriptional regulator [Alphaproteobacteria bacterium]|nr:LysR family transcriptional regulator [Alphaproteobacteria bacterium]